MDTAAALMNNQSKSIYPYSVQLEFLNMALRDMQEYYELNNVPVTDTFTSDPIVVPANVDHIGFAPDPPVVDTPYLPDDLVEPKLVWESTVGINQYTPMSRLDALPRYMEGVEINQFLYYVWQTNQIKVLPCNQINSIKMDYTRYLFTTITDPDTNLAVINSKSYLQYRTAGHLAQFLAENPTRAQSLYGEAQISLDKALGITAKGRQAITIRHRPFRAGYKRRTFS